MAERLQKIISAAGLCSRRAAEKLITEGRVRINGAVATLGMSADPDTDEITVDGAAVKPKPEHTYIMLNKPKGYVTTMSDERGRKTVAELAEGAGTRLYPVGRLDINSEGLLVMTDDGDAACRLTHPSHSVDKTYVVTVSCPDPEAGKRSMEKLRELEGEAIRPPRVDILKKTPEGAVLAIVIHEGKNRQVRRMCALAQMTVLRLVRVAEGPLALGGLPTGEWRYLTQDEIQKLQDIM